MKIDRQCFNEILFEPKRERVHAQDDGEARAEEGGGGVFRQLQTIEAGVSSRKVCITSRSHDVDAELLVLSIIALKSVGGPSNTTQHALLV